jgi:hypothetical protein
MVADATPSSAMKLKLREGPQMKLSKYRARAAGSRSARTAAIMLFLLSLLVTLSFASSAGAATPVPLGTADSFAILAGAGITQTGPNTIMGDIGTFPTTTISGPGTLILTGTNHGGDGVTQGAKGDLTNAYLNAAAQGPTMPIVADLGGQVLSPGVHNSGGQILLTGAVTLDGQGDPNAVFIFQAGSSLTTASASVVNLVNGAQSCNVFWQVTSDATLGTNSVFRGTILALTSIWVTTGVNITGRVLARNGEVTLDTDTITRPTCATLPSSTPTPPDTTAADAAAAAATAEAARAAAVKAAAVKAAAVKASRARAARLRAARLKAARVKAARVKAAKAAEARRNGETSTQYGFARPPRSRVGLTG